MLQKIAVQVLLECHHCKHLSKFEQLLYVEEKDIKIVSVFVFNFWQLAALIEYQNRVLQHQMTTSLLDFPSNQ